MLPLIRLEGEPFEQGYTHGVRARERVQHNLRVYFDRFHREGRISRAEVLQRAGKYHGAIRTQCPAYAETMRGIAKGAACDLREIVALNVRYEILYHQFTANALSDGCTAFAVLPERTMSKHLLLAENWDWIPQVQGAVLHVKEKDLEVLCFTEAGITGGKIGLNSAGLGLAINGLISTDDDWSRVTTPFHVRCYEVLRAKNVADAARIVSEGKRACSANFLIAQVEESAVDIEAAPLAARTLTPEDGLLIHTNHFLEPEALGVVEPPTEKRPHSYHRLRCLQRLLAGGHLLTPEDMKDYLRDHDGRPYSICRHIDEAEPLEEHYQTVTSVVMDLHERAMWISDGPPCENEYQELGLQPDH
jgi:isopenicillin-N N-acyltransferase-like protein